ncbi:lipocalin family protein [Flavobacterium gelidilacus]|uniref:lipocalin family protein n=1 Tax=Flavobacterium gelidilacus TaxID=206041 RepID=UPI00040E6487|nr:lipocalin family protein [Flavobacterium gelidilacus]
MKKSYLILITIITLSCSKNDDNETANNSIYGNWKLTTANGIAITDCEAQFPNFILNTNNTGNEGFGATMPNGNCIDDSRDIQFTLENNILSVKEINTNPANYIFETKRTVTSITNSELKLKIFYVRQSNPSGGVDVDNIPASEQTEYLYLKEN